MEKLLTVEDVAEKLQVTRATAYKYIRQMRHMESPVRVTESDLNAWVMARMTAPGDRMEPEKKRRKKPEKGRVIPMPGPDGKYHVPRRRIG